MLSGEGNWAGLLGLLCIVMFWGFSIYKWTQYRSLRKRLVHVEGTIVDKTKNGNHEYAIIQFYDQAGHMYQVTRRNQSEIGAQKKLYYDPKNPQDVFLDHKVMEAFFLNGVIYSSVILFALSMMMILS